MVARRAEKATRRGISPLLLLILLVAVVSVGGVVGWNFLGSNLVATRAAQDELVALKAALEQPPVDDTVARPADHEAAWVLRIPRLGIETPVIAGVDESDLRRGVGWYPGTALPGEVGNFALAGYRFSNGEPFRRLLDLHVGDEVIVDTAQATFTYTMISAPSDLTVQADDSWVLNPVPGSPDQVPTQSLLTLTTAEDVIDTPDRSVGFGTLTRTETR